MNPLLRQNFLLKTAVGVLPSERGLIIIIIITGGACGALISDKRAAVESISSSPENISSGPLPDHPPCAGSLWAMFSDGA